MNEVLLIIVFVVIVLGLIFLLKRVPQPTRLYIRIGAGLLLLALIWFTGETRQLSLKILFTVLIISSWYRAYWEYKKDTASQAPAEPTSDN